MPKIERGYHSKKVLRILERVPAIGYWLKKPQQIQRIVEFPNEKGVLTPFVTNLRIGKKRLSYGKNPSKFQEFSSKRIGICRLADYVEICEPKPKGKEDKMLLK